jgi:hypothetical protein
VVFQVSCPLAQQASLAGAAKKPKYVGQPAEYSLFNVNRLRAGSRATYGTFSRKPARFMPATVYLGRRDFAYELNKMRTRGCGVKPIGEILRFVGHQSFAEFHDAHRV